MVNRHHSHPASFRDPSGFIFAQDGTIYRQINKTYKTDYDFFLSSGLYQKLIESGFLIHHTESDITPPLPELAYKIIQPEQVPFISYPYEWSFSMYKDAALATLRIQQIALAHGMSLKDASAYNMQFFDKHWKLIDTLSFEKTVDGQPWVAYKQFCQHFLAPLALMAKSDIRLNSMMRTSINGIPLDLCAKLLPKKTKFNFSLLTHIHMHAKSQSHFADKQVAGLNKKKISPKALLGILDSLTTAITKLHLNRKKTEWGDYYNETNYSESGFQSKINIVTDYIDRAKPTSLIDLGANDGTFSSIASNKNIPTIASDIDPIAVEKNYLRIKKNNNKHLIPLLQDLTNPSPSIGWANEERASFINRASNHTVMALALIHHLAISNNLPFEKIFSFFHRLADKYLIVEFIPKSDSQVQRLLVSRDDIFKTYDISHFEKALQSYFFTVEKREIIDTNRTLFLLEKKQ